MIDWLRPPVDGTPRGAFAASRVWVGRAVSLYKYLEGGIDISCRSGEDASCFHPTSRADRLLLPNWFEGEGRYWIPWLAGVLVGGYLTFFLLCGGAF